jgi:nickel/cobalt exporter
MNALTDLVRAGTGNAWLFVPSAILLGALHGLEPGHSKTMMAAFIVAVRGTVGQAVLLGLSATLSHTAVVWLVALVGIRLGRDLDVETAEPYFQVVSGILILGIAAWMVWRTARDNRRSDTEHDHHHHDHHVHAHDDIRRIDTGHGVIALEVFEDGVPPRWRLTVERGAAWAPGDVTIETERPDGARQRFAFAAGDGYLESVETIPEPHAFTARLRLAHGGHAHDYDLAFAEPDHHNQHDHDHGGLDLGDLDDAHALAHANDIRRRFAGRPVTTGQIVMFGLTGGLIPCPAAITVLLLCLQLKEVTLGVALVLCFSIGLALTMVSAGAFAAIGMRHVERRWSGFGAFAQRAPYVSGVVISLVGLAMLWQGWSTLPLG